MGGLFETVLSSDYLTTRPRNAIPKFTQKARESHRPSFSLQPPTSGPSSLQLQDARCSLACPGDVRDPLQRNRTQSSRSLGQTLLSRNEVTLAQPLAAPVLSTWGKRAVPCWRLTRCALVTLVPRRLISTPVDNTTNGGVHQRLGREGQGWGG